MTADRDVAFQKKRVAAARGASVNAFPAAGRCSAAQSGNNAPGAATARRQAGI
jgi:hypothetical protein